MQFQGDHNILAESFALVVCEESCLVFQVSWNIQCFYQQFDGDLRDAEIFQYAES